MSIKKDKANLLAIIDSIDKIQEYISGMVSPHEYYSSNVVFDATLMNFIIIGEMTDRISTEMKAKYQEIDWQKVKDFRNLVAHDYLGIDAEEVWQIIQNHLPLLKKNVEHILKIEYGME